MFLLPINSAALLELLTAGRPVGSFIIHAASNSSSSLAIMSTIVRSVTAAAFHNDFQFVDYEGGDPEDLLSLR